MSAEVEQVDGVEVAGDGDEGEGARGFSEDDGAADGDAVHDDPDVGGAGVDEAGGAGGGGIGGRDEVFPAAEVVIFADGGDGLFVGDAVGAEAHGVDGDAVELAEGEAAVGVAVWQERGSRGEEVAVEGEAFLHGGERGEVGERGRNPLKRYGGGGDDGGRTGVERRVWRGVVRGVGGGLLRHERGAGEKQNGKSEDR